MQVLCECWRICAMSGANFSLLICDALCMRECQMVRPRSEGREKRCA